jgi:hypothetical protein
MQRMTVRKAKKVHYCSRCHAKIEPGTRYLEHVASPDHDDLGNEGWWRLAECIPCADLVRGVTLTPERIEMLRIEERDALDAMAEP